MSQNADHYQLTTPSSSNSSRNTKRNQSHQHFHSIISNDFTTPPSSIVNNIQNESPITQVRTSPIINDICTDPQNSVENASTTMKIRDINSSNGNHRYEKCAFTIDLSPSAPKTRKDRHRKLPQYTLEMPNKDDEHHLHAPFELDVPVCENQSSKRIQNDFLIDRMLKDDSNSNITSQSFNGSSPLLTPSSDHADIDALSDAGTYVIEDDGDIACDDEPEQDLQQQNESYEQNSLSLSTSSPFKRYAATRKNRHGTFEIHSLTSPATHTVNRPIVDLNVPTRDLSSSSSSRNNSSSSSSLLSLPTESDNSMQKEPEETCYSTLENQSSTGIIYARQRSDNRLQQQQQQSLVISSQNQIKPAECFVISPTLETKHFPNAINLNSRKKSDTQWKPKPTVGSTSTKESNIEMASKRSPPSPPFSTRSNQSDSARYSFRLQPQSQQQRPSTAVHKSTVQNTDYVLSSPKLSVRPHTLTTEQIGSSPFQRNSSVRQTMPAGTQYNRPMSSSTTSTTRSIDDNEESLSTQPSLTKVYMNKSFALRRQHSNIVPSTAKPIQQQAVSKQLPARTVLKSVTSVPTTTTTSTNNSSGQTNRAVELRRARAQAKIEELAQRTRHQLQKTEQHTDLMSASWHSNASGSSKKDLLNVRSTTRSVNANHPTIKQDLLKTRTISSSSSHHRSSSASPNPNAEITPTIKSKYRKSTASNVNGHEYYNEERCDSLRDDGQRLAIKLIQLSSGILAKLKPNHLTGNNDSNVRELEQLVDQLQTVNETLSTIDAALIERTSDETIL